MPMLQKVVKFVLSGPACHLRFCLSAAKPDGAHCANGTGSEEEHAEWPARGQVEVLDNLPNVVQVTLDATGKVKETMNRR